MLEKIKEILVEQLNCDADSINEDTSFKDDLGADSLDLYEMGESLRPTALVVALEAVQNRVMENRKRNKYSKNWNNIC